MSKRTDHVQAMCMAVALLVGLGANALFGLSWLDPAAALAIAGLAISEGIKTWRGEGCCAPGVPAGGAGRAEDCCD